MFHLTNVDDCWINILNDKKPNGPQEVCALKYHALSMYVNYPTKVGKHETFSFPPPEPTAKLN